MNTAAINRQYSPQMAQMGSSLLPPQLDWGLITLTHTRAHLFAIFLYLSEFLTLLSHSLALCVLCSVFCSPTRTHTIKRARVSE